MANINARNTIEKVGKSITSNDVKNIELVEGEKYCIFDSRVYEMEGDRKVGKNKKHRNYIVKIVKNYTHHILAKALFEKGVTYSYCINKIDIATGRIKFKRVLN